MNMMGTFRSSQKQDVPPLFIQTSHSCIASWDTLLEAGRAYANALQQAVDSTFDVLEKSPLDEFNANIRKLVAFLIPATSTQRGVNRKLEKIVKNLNAPKLSFMSMASGRRVDGRSLDNSVISSAQRKLAEAKKQEDIARNRAASLIDSGTSRDGHNKILGLIQGAQMQAAACTFQTRKEHVNMQLLENEYMVNLSGSLAQGANDLLNAERTRLSALQEIFTEVNSEMQQDILEQASAQKAAETKLMLRRKRAYEALNDRALYNFELNSATAIQQSYKTLDMSNSTPSNINNTERWVYDNVQLYSERQLFVGTLVLTRDLLRFRSYPYRPTGANHLPITAEGVTRCTYQFCEERATDHFLLRCDEHKVPLEQAIEDSIEVVLPIDSIVRLKEQTNEVEFLSGVKKLCMIWSKDLSCRAFAFVQSGDETQFLQKLNQFLFSESLLVYRTLSNLQRRRQVAWPAPLPVPYVYNPVTEYTRLQALTCPLLRKSPANSTYSKIPTYGALLIVPKNASPAVVAGSIAFRSKGRFPALCWRPPWEAPGKRAPVMFRSSQPAVGISGARSKLDEKLIECFSEITPEPKDSQKITEPKRGLTKVKEKKEHNILIADCRPQLNARANQAKGFGTENIAYYPDCSLQYLGIANIHAVRRSLTNWRVASLEPFMQEYLTTGHWWALPPQLTSYGQRCVEKLREHSWARHIASILSGAVEMVRREISPTR
jgi:hypothetical protein